MPQGNWLESIVFSIVPGSKTKEAYVQAKARYVNGLRHNLEGRQAAHLLRMVDQMVGHCAAPDDIEPPIDLGLVPTAILLGTLAQRYYMINVNTIGFDMQPGFYAQGAPVQVGGLLAVHGLIARVEARLRSGELDAILLAQQQHADEYYKGGTDTQADHDAANGS